MHIVVLGAGPGGLSAAYEGIHHGHAVTIVDPEGLGGNALRHSLVPSKVLIRTARALQIASRMGGQWNAADWPQVMAVQRGILDRGEKRAQQQLRNARVILEAGRISGPREVVTDKSATVLRADVLIIAVGSRQRLIPGVKPDGFRVWIPRIFHTLKALPEELAIMGAGATGLEAASLFAQFGVKVHVYTPHKTLLPSYAPEIGDRLTSSLQEMGVIIHWNRRTRTLEALKSGGVAINWESPSDSGRDLAPHVLIAAGREPMWDRDSLEAAGFELTDDGFFHVSEVGQTSVAGVYAVGDAAGGPMLANKAWHDGRNAVRHALDLPLDLPQGPLVEAIYTDPEVARVGQVTDYVHPITLDESWLYYPVLADDDLLFGRVYTDNRGAVVGAEIIGEEAAEVVSSLTVAIAGRLTLWDLRRIRPASPSILEVLAVQDPLQN